MNKNTSKKDTDIIAVHNGVFYEYHDESWHEKESWRIDDELEGERLIARELYKDTNELKSIPKLIPYTSELPITPSERPRVSPCSIETFKSLISTSVIEVRVLRDVTKE